MAPDQTERYMNIKATSRHFEGKVGSRISFLYPAIYTLACRLNVRYFPFDQQNCTLVVSFIILIESTDGFFFIFHLTFRLAHGLKGLFIRQLSRFCASNRLGKLF